VLTYMCLKRMVKYILPLLLIGSLIGQDIKKDGKTPTTFTYTEALQMIKQRDAEWEGKIEKADSLIASQKVVISDCENLIVKLEESSTVDSLLLEAKDAQITLLKARDEANEKLLKLVEPKWYESTYIWLAAGFILGIF